MAVRENVRSSKEQISIFPKIQSYLEKDDTKHRLTSSKWEHVSLSFLKSRLKNIQLNRRKYQTVS